MKEGDVIVSVESFFAQKESYESIQALEDCMLYYISYDELQAIYRNYPEFNFIARVLLEKYYMLSEQRLYSLQCKNRRNAMITYSSIFLNSYLEYLLNIWPLTWELQKLR